MSEWEWVRVSDRVWGRERERRRPSKEEEKRRRKLWQKFTHSKSTEMDTAYINQPEKDLSGQPVDRLKLLYPNVDEKLTPLPRSWSSQEKCNSIGLTQNNLRVHYKGFYPICQSLPQWSTFSNKNYQFSLCWICSCLLTFHSHSSKLNCNSMCCSYERIIQIIHAYLKIFYACIGDVCACDCHC